MFIGTLSKDKANVLCCKCHLLGVYESGTFWRCERCGGSMFWRADRSASYDKIRDVAGGDDKLLNAIKWARRIMRRQTLQQISGVK